VEQILNSMRSLAMRANQASPLTDDMDGIIYFRAKAAGGSMIALRHAVSLSTHCYRYEHKVQNQPPLWSISTDESVSLAALCPLKDVNAEWL
jgi:hypothetical protein